MNTKWLSAAAVVAALAIPTGISATAHAAAAPAASGFYQDRPWETPPAEYRDVKRKGFNDGIQAAHHDWDRHDVNKRPEDHERFRNPPVAGDLRNDYREGFTRGYQVALQHMRDEQRNRQ